MSTQIDSVIIADVVKSSELSDESRRDLDKLLRGMFTIYEEKYKTSLLSSITFSLGDEFQAVLSSADSAVLPALQMQSWLALQSPDRPYRIRTAIGVGRVSVTTSRVAREQDGPAFHVARKLIHDIHKQKTLFGIRCHGSSPLIQLFNNSFDISCRFVSSALLRWTQPQWEAIYWKWEGESSKQIAERLGVRPQNISKRLTSANFQAVDQALKGFATILRHPALLDEMSSTSRK